MSNGTAAAGLPLAGITVVTVEQAVAVPFASRQLADLGARVIKIERPSTGDFARGYDRAVRGESSYFVWLNRGKESLALDLKLDADRRVLDVLLDGADVFLQNLAPGAADRLGLSPDELRERNPRLVTCSVSGYGTGGPYSTKRAYDLLVQCEAGLLELNGTPDEGAKVALPIADIAAGMYAYSGVLTALFDRETTGKGSSIEVSMLEALGEWMSQPVYYTRDGGQTMSRSGARHATIAPYGPYSAGDGKVLFLGIQNAREWQRFCEQVLADPALEADERFVDNTARLANDDELTRLIEAALSAVTAAEAVEILDAAGIATALVRTPLEFADHPQLAARSRWRSVATPVGAIQAPLPPATFDGWEARMGDVPSLGQHSESIRAELGLA